MKLKNRSKKHYVALLAAVPVIGASAAAFAFPFGYSWMEPANGVAQNLMLAHDVRGRAGGHGLWGTGSKLDKGLKCSHCHTDPAGLIDALVEFNPPLSGGTKYVPGQTYQLTVTLLNEQKLPGNGVMNTLNGFALAFEDVNGQRSGVLRSDIAGVDSQSCPQAFPVPAPTNGTSYVYGNCNAIVFVPSPNSTVWYAGWTAPGAGSGQIKMWYAVADGDQDGGSSLGDDVREGLVTIDEGP